MMNIFPSPIIYPSFDRKDTSSKGSNIIDLTYNSNNYPSMQIIGLLSPTNYYKDQINLYRIFEDKNLLAIAKKHVNNKERKINQVDVNFDENLNSKEENNMKKIKNNIQTIKDLLPKEEKNLFKESITKFILDKNNVLKEERIKTFSGTITQNNLKERKNNNIFHDNIYCKNRFNSEDKSPKETCQDT